jgi:hypothetical protein
VTSSEQVQKYQTFAETVKCRLDTRSCSLSLLLELIKFLLLEGSWLAEVENNVVSGQLGVGMGHSFKTWFHQVTVKWVKEDLFSSLSAGCNTDGAASDATWGDDVIKKGLVNCLKSAGTRSLL